MENNNRLNLVVHTSVLEANGIEPVILNDDEARVMILAGFAESSEDLSGSFREYRYGQHARCMRELGFKEGARNNTWEILNRALDVPGVLIYFIHVPDDLQLRGQAGIEAIIDYVSDVANCTDNEYWKDLIAVRRAVNPSKPIMDTLHA